MTPPFLFSVPHRRRSARELLFLVTVMLCPALLMSDEITTGTLTVQGSGLRVVTISATTAIDVPAQIQTEFAGRQGDEAPVAAGIVAVGELTGPGIDTAIRLETTPGHAFHVPGLSREGIYLLQNVRLMRGSEFLQSATPSSASITVTDALKTTVKVRQLTPDEIRSRGIQVDSRNFDVFEDRAWNTRRSMTSIWLTWFGFPRALTASAWSKVRIWPPSSMGKGARFWSISPASMSDGIRQVRPFRRKHCSPRRGFLFRPTGLTE